MSDASQDPSTTRKPTSVDAKIGRRLRQRRSELGLSLDDVGKQLGITNEQLRKYEIGGNRIGAARLYQLSFILSVPLLWFFRGGDAKAGSVESTNETTLSFTEVDALLQAHSAIADPHQRQRLIQIARILAQH